MTGVTHDPGAAAGGAALRDELLDFAFSEAPVVYFIEDAAAGGAMLFVSDNVEALTGHPPSAFRERPGFLREAIHARDLPAVDAVLARAQSGGVVSVEYRLAAASGEYRWVRDRRRLARDAAGRARYTGCLVDISDHKRREVELWQAGQTLEDAIESLHEGFVLFDADDRLITCNSRYESFNPLIQDLLVPGTPWVDLARARAERGQFEDALGRVDEWLAERIAERGRVMNNVFQLTDGRWFEDSHRRTRHGGLVTTWREVTESKEMERALRESETRVRRVLEACPLPVRLWDLDKGHVVYESPAARSLLGYDEVDVPYAERASIYVDPELRDRYLERLRAERAVDNMEAEIRRADGSSFWGAVSARRIVVEGDELIVSSIVDLTEIRERERELRQTREVLEDAIESLHEGFALYDAAHRLVLCNSRYRDFHGAAAELLVPGASWHDVTRRRAELGLFAAARGRVDEWVEEVTARRGTAQDQEFQFVGGRWYAYSHRPTRQGGFVSTWRETTERKAMEQSLRESEEMLRRVLSACPLPITMYRVEDGHVIYANPAAELLFGARGSEGSDRATRWASADTRRRVQGALLENGFVDDAEVELVGADGEVFWGAVSERLIDYQGVDVSVSCVFDLTERREVEDEMARQRELLHHSEKLSALGELLAGVAHELNNPLSVLVGNALLLRETATDEAVERRAERISESADRCARIVRTFLSMARQRPAETRPVGVNEVVRSALEVTGYALRTAGIEVETAFAPDLPAVLADEDQLRQVFTNLLVNAEHALREVDGERRLRVASRLHPDGGEIAVRVEDNGPGIPESIQGRVFEPLFTTKGVGTGTGIGLALCHRIVEAHGGAITLASAQPGGTAFTVHIPVGEAIAGPDRGAGEALGEERALRVLVIDDEPDVADLLGDILELDGHSVSVAGSGDRALARLAEATFDLVLSDMRMPGMDGPQLFDAIGQLRPELARRVVFVTGDTMSPSVRAFLDSTGCRFLEKPISPDELRALVRTLER